MHNHVLHTRHRDGHHASKKAVLVEQSRGSAMRSTSTTAAMLPRCWDSCRAHQVCAAAAERALPVLCRRKGQPEAGDLEALPGVFRPVSRGQEAGDNINWKGILWWWQLPVQRCQAERTHQRHCGRQNALPPASQPT